MFHSQEDILSEFKSKINEAISLVSKIPVQQKAEVWNFWELITISVKLVTQVYVEDHVNTDTRKNHEVPIEKSDQTNDPTENKLKTFQKKKRRLKKQSNERKIENIKTDEKYESHEKVKVDKYEGHSDSDQNDNDSVRHDVKTIDFTDLISYPSSVDTVVQHDETTSMLGMPSCSTPSTTIVPHSDDTSLTEIITLENDKNSSGTVILNVPQPDISLASVDMNDKEDSSGSVSQVNRELDSSVTMHLEALEKNLNSPETEIIILANNIDSSGLDRETSENSLDSSAIENSEHITDSPLVEGSSCEGDLSVSESDSLDTKKNEDQRVNVIHAEIIQTDEVKTRDKENKVPPLTLRKTRKSSKDEGIYITCDDDDSDRPVKYLLNRKSCRQKRKLQHEEFVYEVAVERKKIKETQKKRDQFTCDICGKKLSNLTALKAHSRQHTGQRPFACTVCGRTFSTNGNRLRHEKSHAGEKEFQCPICQKWFTSATNLEIHRRVHTGEKPYICEVCDKRFTQQGSLKAHLDLHKGEKNFLCTVCGRAFTQKTNLESHLLRHNKNNRNYKCPHCSYSFFTKGELERHSFKHTKEKPYLCDYCPKSFTRSQYLKDHKILHVKPKPYSCNKCEETFVDVSSLRKHKQWHRVIESQEKEGEVTDEQGEITDEQEEIQEDIQQTCIVTTSEITGMKQIIMATDKDLSADVLQQFVDGGHVESDSMEVTHIVPVLDKDGNVTQVDSLDESSQDIYQITFLDANSDSDHSNIIAAVDFSAMNLLANATSHQFN